MKKLLVVLLVLGLAVPAMAADWHFYGSARTHLGYYDVDENFATGPATDPSIRSNGLDDDAGTTLNLYGQSRFGAKVIASDSLTGFVEFGLRETNGGADEPEAGDGVYLRLLGGVWNFGAGSLMVGKNYTPATFLGYSGMGGDLGDNGDANMLVSGLAYIGRQPQIRLSFGTFDFALIQPNSNANDLGAGDIDFVIPRVEAAYVFRTPVIAIRPVAGFQTYKAENQATGDDETITSYTLGLGVSATLGPAYIKATFSYVQNPQNYGQTNLLVADATGLGAARAGLVGGDVEDSTLMQGTFVVGVKINEAFGIEAGVGYGDVDRDDCDLTALGLGIQDVEQTGFVYYLQAPIVLAKGVTLTPEIGFMDRDDLEVGGTDVDAGDMMYADISFKVDF